MAEEVVNKEIRSCTQSTEDWEHLKLKIKLKQPGEWLGGEFRGYLIPHPHLYFKVVKYKEFQVSWEEPFILGLNF